MKLKDTIGVFENAFSKDECEALINRHEVAIKTGIAYGGKSGDGGETVNKKSTDYNILHQNNDMDDKLSEMVLIKFNQYIGEYLINAPYADTFYHNRIVNGITDYPLLQMQKYDKNEGHYNTWHVEKEHLKSAQRMFVLILYLNDVEEGGETGFLFKEEGEDDFYKVKPKAGKLIIHPCSWPYVHKGYTPESDDKYILTTWLEYVQ